MGGQFPGSMDNKGFSLKYTVYDVDFTVRTLIKQWRVQPQPTFSFVKAYQQIDCKNGVKSERLMFS